MTELLKIISTFFDVFHEGFVDLFKLIGFNLTDKQLHFWIIGIIGIIIFIVVDQLFKALAKWHISSISFIFTFTVLIVITFSIEIQQRITGSGNMEFGDVVAGIWGFLGVFFAYLIIRIAVFVIQKAYRQMKNRRKEIK